MAQLGIDLGTAHTTICETSTGVIREASAVVFDANERIVSIGNAASEMEGRVSEQLRVERPIVAGSIGDFDAARALIVHMLERAAGTRRLFGVFLATVPACATDIERKAVEEVLRGLGGRSVRLVPKSLAVLRGTGIEPGDTRARMIVDIGAGTTEIAVISFDDLVAARSLKIGGNAIDAAILQRVRLEHRLQIGRPSSEALKLALAYIGAPLGRPSVPVSGHDLTGGRPARMKIDEELVGSAVVDTVEAILNGIDDLLAQLAPDVAIDVSEHGILLCGGSAQIPGLPQAITERTKMPSRVVENPMDCAAQGARLLAHQDLPLELLRT